jgi:hypothetical protein
LDWRTKLLQELERSGDLGFTSVQYLRQHGIRLALRAQSSGAQWRPWKRILLRPDVVNADHNLAYAMSLVVHEVRHLQQGWVVALSVYGELEAWQLQFRYLKSIDGEAGASGRDFSAIEELLCLPLSWDRGVLRTARALMRTYGGPRYRADRLPLYPIREEVLYHLGIWRPPRAG